MPATNIPSQPAASTVQVALNGSGGADNAATGAESGKPSPFAALFQKLAAQQPATDGATVVLELKAEIAAEGDPVQANDALAALMPFLEAMGLRQAGQQPAANDERGKVKSDKVLPMTEDVIPLAVPIGASAAISAADTATEAADAAKTSNAAEDLTSKIRMRSDLADTRGSSREVSDGRAFSSELVSAIEASKEQPRQPGATAQAVHQVMAGNPSPNANGAAPGLQVAQTVGSPGWGHEVGDKIVWMASRMESRAELVLTPPQMGRVEVSLTIAGDQATALFVSANPAVREALEAALPRLREALAEAGIQLGQAQVGAENPQPSAQQEKNGDNPNFGRGTEQRVDLSQTTDKAAPGDAGLKNGRGLVDVFA